VFREQRRPFRPLTHPFYFHGLVVVWCSQATPARFFLAGAASLRVERYCGEALPLSII
jgi:hypothetical protein